MEHPTHFDGPPDLGSYLEGRVYKCPCCFYSTEQEYKINLHMENHKQMAVQYKGFLIYKCNRDCRKAAHFHCILCRSTIIRKDQFINHLSGHLSPGSSPASISQPPAPGHPAPGHASISISRPPAPGHASISISRPPAPGHASISISRPPAPGHASISISQPPAPGHASISQPPAPGHASISQPPAPGHASISQPPAPGHASISQPPAPGHASISISQPPAPGHPAPGHASISISRPPAPGHASISISRPPAPGHASISISQPPAPGHPAPGQTSIYITQPPAPGHASIVPPPPPKRKGKDSVICPHCGITLNRRNLRLHLQRFHTLIKPDITSQHHLKCQCIDFENGIFAVNKSFSTPSTPVHVIKRTWGQSQRTSCEMEACRINMECAERSRMRTFECPHIQSVSYCPPASHLESPLSERGLLQMVAEKWFGQDKQERCLARQRAAVEVGTPLSCLVNISGPPSKKYISVFEPMVAYYSRLGRVMVSYDTKTITWHCPCAKPRQSCTHKYVAKWHLFEKEQALFRRTKCNEAEEGEELFSTDMGGATVEDGAGYPPKGEQLVKMVRDMYKNKKIPAVLPHDTVHTSSFPFALVPPENFCRECHTMLSEPGLITSKARIVTMTDVIEGISLYSKWCYQCGLVYRYQEWSDGIHNFDDHTLLSLHLCLFLRNSLQTHQAVGSVVEVLEKTSGKRYPSAQKILQAYLTFEALCDHSYTFACVSCGYHPVTVVMDLHKKGVFSMPVSTIEEPPADFDGKVDAEEFWEKVSMEVISRGLVSCKKENPFIVPPSYHNWAPWIGPHTRSGNVVLNTEYKKVHSPHSPAEELELTVTEDRLTDELLKVKMGDLRGLCGQCGVDPQGSRMDIVSRLQQEMKNRDTYDKVFSQIWGASGGWAVVTCPCAVVYAVKFNIRAESPRDYTDLLLSMKHFPNVTLYDFARGLATHANNRVPDTFRPHGGRLLEPTEVNIARATAGDLKVNLPWIHEKKKVPDPDGHPFTGSSAHYAIYDRFHEDNTKDKSDVLRKMELVPEILGWVNSQTAEQLFSGMRRNNHFMNMMTPSSHVFLMRNILHHYNSSKNAVKMEKLKKTLGQDVTLNHYGQAVLDSSTLQQGWTDVDTLEAVNHHVSAEQGPTKLEEMTKVDLKAGMPCGPHCADVLSVGSIEANRSCWSFDLHRDQEEVLRYVLDPNKPAHELIVRNSDSCLTRSDFHTLGLRQQMESTIGNACFDMIGRIAVSKGKKVHIVGLYVCPTWLPPVRTNPMASIPSQAHQMDAIFIPLWTPGHYQICVIKPAQKQILFLDSLYAMSESGFSATQYIPLLRNIAQHISAGPWEEITGKELQGFPSQQFGLDCGIFMITAALYIALDAKFDYSICDMPALRRWWCLLLLENDSLDSHGQIFAHWTAECKELLSGNYSPVFRLKRRRNQDSEAEGATAEVRHCPAPVSQALFPPGIMM